MMERRSIKTDRGRVFYWISEKWDEKKRTVVFLHGLTADHRMFKPQVTYFQKKYNIITWDAPAHGESRPYVPFSYLRAVEALREILEENQVASAVMIGQSLGGYIIQSFIQRYPTMVDGFVGIDTTPYGEEYYSRSDRWWLRQVEWMSHLYPYQVMVKAIAKQVSVTKEGYENMMDMLCQYDKNELCHLMGIGYAGFLEDNKDMQISCPVLILLGDKDKTGKVPQYCRAWAKKTGYPLKMISNAAHNSNVDNPEEANQAIEEFLKELY